MCACGGRAGVDSRRGLESRRHARAPLHAHRRWYACLRTCADECMGGLLRGRHPLWLATAKTLPRLLRCSCGLPRVDTDTSSHLCFCGSPQLRQPRPTISHSRVASPSSEACLVATGHISCCGGWRHRRCSRHVRPPHAAAVFGHRAEVAASRGWRCGATPVASRFEERGRLENHRDLFGGAVYPRHDGWA